MLLLLNRDRDFEEIKDVPLIYFQNWHAAMVIFESFKLRNASTIFKIVVEKSHHNVELFLNLYKSKAYSIETSNPQNLKYVFAILLLTLKETTYGTPNKNRNLLMLYNFNFWILQTTQYTYI